MRPAGYSSTQTYQLVLRGSIDESWLDWLGPVQVQTEGAAPEAVITTISNINTDQAGIVGLIRRLHAIGVVLVSMQCQPSP